MSVVVLFCPERSVWVRYERPVAVFCAHDHCAVPGMLTTLEDRVEREGLHAAGFLSYEAGFAFDPAMPRQTSRPFPLAWFGLFEPPLPTSLESGDLPPLNWTSELDAAAHARGVARIRDYLAQGETYQVNFTYRLHTPFAGDPWTYFSALVARQPSGHGAFVDTGDFAICSASPEMFFWRDGDNVWSRPMKGTARRGRWTQEDERIAAVLTKSDKERAENVMIVDMVRNDLGRICLPGSVRAEELFRAERYPTLWQLTSLVTGQTTLSTAQVMAALFPAASITGAPKVRTMRLIQELETSPRRIYTGTIGVIAPGRKARFNVAIRTVLVDRNRGEAEYGVGGGIVWDSVPGDEYQETRVKARVLSGRSPEFRLIETMRWTRDEGIVLYPEHRCRLRDSAEYFGFVLDLDQVDRLLNQTVATIEQEDMVLRLELDRVGRVTVNVRPVPASGPCRVALSRAPVDSSDLFLFHRTTCRAVYDRALAELGDRQDVDDVLLWNERHELTESSIANVVVELDGERVTPARTCGLLAGTLRSRLLAQGQIRERVIGVDELKRATGLWLINSVRGWRKAELQDELTPCGPCGPARLRPDQ